MIPFLLVLIPSDLPDVSESDVLRFPSWHECSLQIDRSNKYMEWLRFISRYHRGSSEQLDRQIAQLQWNIDTWDLIARCQSPGWGGVPWKLTLLDRLRDRIGPYQYGRGWHPPFLDLANIPTLQKWETECGGS